MNVTHNYYIQNQKDNSRLANILPVVTMKIQSWDKGGCYVCTVCIWDKFMSDADLDCLQYICICM